MYCANQDQPCLANNLPELLAQYLINQVLCKYEYINDSTTH